MVYNLQEMNSPFTDETQLIKQLQKANTDLSFHIFHSHIPLDIFYISEITKWMKGILNDILRIYSLLPSINNQKLFIDIHEELKCLEPRLDQLVHQLTQSLFNLKNNHVQ